jgi:hypothetical protein
VKYRQIAAKRFGTVLAIASLCLGVGLWARTQTTSPAPPSAQKGTAKTAHARGPFEVKLTPLTDAGAEPGLGRMSAEKQYHGDLDGSGKGQMLTAGSVAKGSAGYVAMELFSGKLAGHTGTFVLQHSGTLDHGAQSLSIIVVPGSGTGELEGLKGKMNIINEAGKHSYDLEYTLESSK